jgi:hypothetical protein
MSHQRSLILSPFRGPLRRRRLSGSLVSGFISKEAGWEKSQWAFTWFLILDALD